MGGRPSLYLTLTLSYSLARFVSFSVSHAHALPTSPLTSPHISLPMKCDINLIFSPPPPSHRYSQAITSLRLVSKRSDVEELGRAMKANPNMSLQVRFRSFSFLSLTLSLRPTLTRSWISPPPSSTTSTPSFGSPADFALSRSA